MKSKISSWLRIPESPKLSRSAMTCFSSFRGSPTFSFIVAAHAASHHLKCQTGRRGLAESSIRVWPSILLLIRLRKGGPSAKMRVSTRVASDRGLSETTSYPGSSSNSRASSTPVATLLRAVSVSSVQLIVIFPNLWLFNILVSFLSSFLHDNLSSTVKKGRVKSAGLDALIRFLFGLLVLRMRLCWLGK